ncbi:unnamed protein product [Symbiodinium pilosum]|uniref:C3H1-type domain-containing protein n=1 Tax=Symbiodinium pilosum TaxID=2952 RepID=A0A812Q5I4_SYMPI|nr:unnamed protein product [Symbiodinium pilosum]
MVRKEPRATKEKLTSGSMRLEAFKQTRLCKFHVAGNCVRGTSCNFAHSIDQIRDQPDFSKTRLCADYLQSQWCRDGQYCKFAHGEHELRPHPSVKHKDQKSKTQPEEKPLAWYADDVNEGCEGWYFIPDGMDAMMYPWYPGYPLMDYPLVHDEYGWDTTSQQSTDWAEWNTTSSNNSTICMESPIESPIESPVQSPEVVVPSLPDEPLLLDAFCTTTQFQDESPQLKVKNTFLHIDIEDDDCDLEETPPASASLRRSPSAPGRLMALFLGEEDD